VEAEADGHEEKAFREKYARVFAKDGTSTNGTSAGDVKAGNDAEPTKESTSSHTNSTPSTTSSNEPGFLERRVCVDYGGEKNREVVVIDWLSGDRRVSGCSSSSVSAPSLICAWHTLYSMRITSTVPAYRL
jgi:hypothetical protein